MLHLEVGHLVTDVEVVRCTSRCVREPVTITRIMLIRFRRSVVIVVMRNSRNEVEEEGHVGAGRWRYECVCGGLGN